MTPPATTGRRSPGHRDRPRRGAVLLEVVLALVLFAATAAVMTVAINASVDSVGRLRQQAHAVDLAVTVLAELEIGARSSLTNGPAPFAPPFESWTWELLLEPVESEAGEPTDLSHVEVVVRHDNPPLVHRYSQILRLERAAEAGATPDDPGSL